MPTKAEITAKIRELNTMAAGLPQGHGKDAIQNIVKKLDTMTDEVIESDGATHPKLTSLPDALAKGDGSAINCC